MPCYKRMPEWSKKEKDILTSSINLIPYSQIATLLPGRTVDAIKQRAQILGLYRSGRHFPSRSLDESFFSNPTLQSSYWAGFIAADGCVIISPRRELRIGIHRRDLGLLRQFCKDVNYDGSIKTNPKNIVSLTICAIDQWINDLDINFGVVHSKPLRRPPIGLDFESSLAYMIGYIDGDGCWHRGKRDRRLALIIVGPPAILQWMRDMLSSFIGDVTVRPGRGCHRLSISGKYAKSVAKLLLASPIKGLHRKWRIAKGEADNQKGGLK